MLYPAEPSNIDSSFLYDMTCILHNNDSLTCGASLLPFLRNRLAHTALNSKSVKVRLPSSKMTYHLVCVCTL